MESESDVIRSVIDEIYSSDIQRVEMEGETGVKGSSISDLHSSDI